MSHIKFYNDTSALNHLWYESHKNLLTSLCIELGHTDKIEELTTKLLGAPLKIKPIKDPNKPKRVKSAYLFFCDEKRSSVMNKLKKNNATIKIADVSKSLGKMWKSLSPANKKKFEKLSQADRERYADEMEQYTS